MSESGEKNPGRYPTPGCTAFVLVLVCLLVYAGARVRIGDWINIDPGQDPPKGDPIRVKLATKLRPLQATDTVHVDFRYHNVGIAHRQTIAGSATLNVHRKQEEHEVELVLPCAATYDYAISNKTALVFRQGVAQGVGTGTGSVTLKDGDVLDCGIDDSDSRFAPVINFRAYLQLRPK